MAEYDFDAFISYSHKDIRWAKWLQQKLEHYSPSRSLRAELEMAERKPLRIFRDQTDLAGVELEGTLQHELARSRYLIVLCSPNSAASPWVEEEIRYFRSLGRREQIIPFIIDGEPESSNPTLECYPKALRDDRDFRYLGASITELGKNKAFLKVLAVLLGVRFDRLVDRNRRHRIRVIAAAAALTVLVGTVVGVLVWNNRKLEDANEELTGINQEFIYEYYATAMAHIARHERLDENDFTIIMASAEAGNTDSMVLLGNYFHYDAPAADKDDSLALQWYEKAANLGNARAMYELGLFYYTGLIVDKDDATAFDLMKRSAEAGFLEAMATTGQFYFTATGTSQDYDQAYRWSKKAAEANEPLAMYFMSIFCYYGIGCEPDTKESFAWLRKSAEADFTDAMRDLGLVYQEGTITEADPGQGLYWLIRAANAGDADSQVLAARSIESESGLSEYMAFLYRLAAEAGKEEAIEALRRLAPASPAEPSEE